MIRPVAREHAGQGAVGGRGNQADAQLAGGARLRAAGERTELLVALEQATGLGEQRVTGGGQRVVPALALEQLGPELGLESADLRAQRRLGHVQVTSGRGEGEVLGDGDEVAQALNGHRFTISIRYGSWDIQILDVSDC